MVSSYQIARARAGAAALAVSPLAPVHERKALPSRLDGHPLIVVHATRAFDSDETAASGVDETIAAFKAQGRPTVYLVDRQDPEGYADWYTRDRAPGYELFSEGGEHNLPLAQDEVTVIGGFFGSYDGHRGCQTLAVRDAVRMHFESSDKPFTVHLPVKAIYFYEEDAGTRAGLLKLDSRDLRRMAEVFKDFPRLFFLTDNFSDVPAFGHPYFGAGGNRLDKSYREGAPVDVDGYAFELFFNGVRVAKFGHGPRKVSLKLAH